MNAPAPPALGALTLRLREVRGDAFPAEGLRLLREAGFMDDLAAATAPRPHGPPAMFGRLVAIGRGDLALGRLYEGHVNAAGLVARLGSRAQRASARGRFSGVWGADDPGDPGRIEADGEGYVLRGRKTYASGAAGLDEALVVVKDEAGRHVVVRLDTDRLAGRFDPAWWTPLGMTTTDSHAVRIEGLRVGADDLLGAPGAYGAQPYFGGGAVRFAAVQLGGVLAVWDAAREHLGRAGRHADPHQAARLGEALAECEGAYAGVAGAYERLAEAISWDGEGEPSDAVIADAARTLPLLAGERIMAIAQRAVGCAGLMDGHPLARAVRDLTVYLRQPAPDAALTRAGAAAGAGTYAPLFGALPAPC